MENIQKNTQRQEPEWEPIEDTPPKRGMLEKIFPPVALIVGILLILVAVMDALFFNIGSRGDQIALGADGVIGIAAWAVSKVMGY